MSKRKTRRALRAVVAFVVLGVAFPITLYAHARLLRSTPEAGARLKTSPKTIQLVFSETPMVAVTSIHLISPWNDTIRLANLRADSSARHAVIAEIQSVLDSGAYVLHWSTAASDGHPSSGVFTFTVDTPRRDTATAALESKAKSRESAASLLKKWRAKRLADAVQFALGTPMWLTRWLAFVALFIVVGAVAFRFLILLRIPFESEAEAVFRDITESSAAAYGMFNAVVLVIATLIRLYGEAAAMNAPVRTILFQTTWGEAWTGQMIACIVAVVAFAFAHRGNRAGWLIAAASAVVLAATPGLTGHALSSDEAMLAVPVDIAHVIAGSVWLGILALILFAGIPAAVKAPEGDSVGERVARFVNAFSPVALVCGAVIVATGVTTSLLHLDRLSRLWTTSYGMTLIVKLALVSLLLSLGAWNWRRVKPNLGGEAGVRALRFSAKLELAASLLVLAVTAFLVALPLPD